MVAPVKGGGPDVESRLCNRKVLPRNTESRARMPSTGTSFGTRDRLQTTFAALMLALAALHGRLKKAWRAMSRIGGLSPG